MQIGIIGQGYVGLSLATRALEAGYQVIGFDTSARLVEELQLGETEIPGIDNNFIKEKISLNLYSPTSDPIKLKGSEILIIAVPTPLDKDRNPDLSFLISACEVIVEQVENEALIVNESTSFPGTLREVVKKICDTSKKANFIYASAPERIDPGNSNWNIKNTPRVVSGLSEIASKKVLDFYSDICTEVVLVESPEVAEASKLYENTFRQVNIALANEFSTICKSMGISAHSAIMAAATKPFGFMAFYPSVGVGGHCIPIDPTYLSHKARALGVSAELIETSNKINLNMTNFIAKKIEIFLGGNLMGKRIQLVGLAYKVNIPDLRESPSINLLAKLRSMGAFVTWHDPIVSTFRGEKSSEINAEVDLGIIITPHDKINLSNWKNSKVAVFDLSPNTFNFGWPKYF